MTSQKTLKDHTELQLCPHELEQTPGEVAASGVRGEGSGKGKTFPDTPRTNSSYLTSKEWHSQYSTIQAKQAREAFGEWLSKPPWEWYVTLTFRDEYVPHNTADKHYYAWMRSLQMACNVKGLPRPFYYRCTEPQQRGTLHFHSLIGGVGDVRRLLFKDFWELNGFARVEKYDAGKGANFYVGKYLNKPDSDIKFSHNLKPYLSPSAGN